MMPWRKRGVALVGVAVVLVLVVALLMLPNRKPLLEQVHWASQPATLIFDHHTHSRYSDGALNLQDLMSAADRGGCDAIAITDHSDIRESLSNRKFAEIDRLRTQYPDMLILAGMELEMPSYEGREHVNILPSPMVERALLSALMDELYSDRVQDPVRLDERMLTLMESLGGKNHNALAIYNHPSRKDTSPSENLEDFRRWHAASSSLIGMSGAPGHQQSDTIGSYNGPFLTQHRWDPAIAKIGGAWDQLLDEGYSVWGAIASSDYHNDNMDYAPCAFSRIHVAAPTRDYRGLMAGMIAGTFWADHGGLLEQLQLRLDVMGVPQPLYPGANAQIAVDDSLATVTLKLRRGPKHVEQALRYDLISNCSTGEATLIDSGYLMPDADSVQRLLAIDLDAGMVRCHLRARIINETLDGEQLAAYTNPIRLILP